MSKPVLVLLICAALTGTFNTVDTSAPIASKRNSNKAIAAEQSTNMPHYLKVEGLNTLQIYQIEGLPAAVATQGTAGLRQPNPTHKKSGKLIIKLYITKDKQLFQWYRASSNAGTRRNSSIIVYDQAGNLQARWKLKNSVPTKYELDTLQVGNARLVLETIELTYEGMERVQ